MSMRPRAGGVGGTGATTPNRTQAGGIWPIFEDFKPTSEWQQDDNSHILIIYLPGFMKEQIRVSTEGRNIIRVRGERLIAGNKWSRFLEDFQVPENSEMNKVRARFQGGILHITIPKTSSTHKPDESTLPPKPSSVHTPNQSNGKKSEPEKKSSIDTARVVDKRNDLDKKTVEKEDMKLAGSKKFLEDETAAEKDKESKRERRIQTSHAEKGAIAMDKHKKGVNGLAELNEERQLLVNMGVAVLVIVAISAYATYKFVSGKDKS